MFKIYQAQYQDRWDTVANSIYGDPFRYLELIENNKHLIGVVIFQGGETIKAPVSDNAVTLDPSKLPPWRR